MGEILDLRTTFKGSRSVQPKQGPIQNRTCTKVSSTLQLSNGTPGHQQHISSGIRRAHLVFHGFPAQRALLRPEGAVLSIVAWQLLSVHGLPALIHTRQHRVLTHVTHVRLHVIRVHHLQDTSDKSSKCIEQCLQKTPRDQSLHSEKMSSKADITKACASPK